MSLVKSINGEFANIHTHTVFMNHRGENRLKFICYLITINMSIITCKLEVLHKKVVLTLKHGGWL